ncbi:MAG: ATP-binding protein [Desulfobacterales bacterium]|nr:ATP-binding protein [Desulfobacterales bacterium]
METTEVVGLNQIIADYLRQPRVLQAAARPSRQSPSETQLDDELLNIVGSPVHLSKTVMNLVSNAAEAMPDGGTIAHPHREPLPGGRDGRATTSAVTGDFVDPRRVRHRASASRPRSMERIFEPFYTKKAMGRSGTGLGMAVVWGTVKDHRGHIDIEERRSGRAPTSACYFPATRAGVPRREDGAAARCVPGPRRGRAGGRRHPRAARDRRRDPRQAGLLGGDRGERRGGRRAAREVSRPTWWCST